MQRPGLLLRNGGQFCLSAVFGVGDLQVLTLFRHRFQLLKPVNGEELGGSLLDAPAVFCVCADDLSGKPLAFGVGMEVYRWLLVNHEMVRCGAAWMYPHFCKFPSLCGEWARLQDEALR